MSRPAEACLPCGPLAAILDSGISFETYPEEFNPLSIDRQSVVGCSGHDTLGHGTRVAACLIGSLSGGSPSSRLISYCCRADQDNYVSESAVCEALYRAVDRGVWLVNCSLAMRRRDRGVERACRAARDAGILILASRPDWSSCWPADLDSVTSVGILYRGTSDIMASDRPRNLCGGRVAGVSYVTAGVSGAVLRSMERLARNGLHFRLETFTAATGISRNES